MTRTLRLNSLVVAAALGVLAGCSSSSASLSSITVSPATASIPKGHTQALTASGNFSDGTKQPIANATWTSSDAAKATVSSSGLVTGVAEGTATITATSAGKSAAAAITVTHSALASIAATPATVTLEIGATQALAVTATYEDTTTAPLTSGVTFAVTAATPAGAATVDASGVITAVAAGTATITATSGGKTATVSVTVNAPALVSISAAPSSVTLEIGKTQAVVVTGTYASGPAAVLTSGVTFAVTAATPSGAATVGASSGLITAVAAGTATVTATASGKTATVSVTVNPKVLLSISATPNPVTVAAGFTQPLAVSGVYSNGDTTPPPPSLSFAVTAATPSGDVTVDASSGLITGVAPGTATITVTSGTKTTTVGVTVTAATLSSIAIDNTSPVALFVTQQATLTVTGTFSDSSTHPLTTGVTFAVTASSPSGAATVGASTGVVTGVAAGTATVTVTHTASGKTASVNVNISAVTLTSITVAPNPVTLPITTGTATFVVTGHYSDSSTATIPNASVTFTPGNSSVVTVSAAGVITAGLAGTTTITVTVSPAPAVDVLVNIYDPASAHVFFDDYDPGVFFSPFGGSVNNVSRDATTLNNGRASLKVVETAAGYTGGALLGPPHDLRAYNAISFWAKASAAVNFDHLGFGDTNNAASGPLISEFHTTAITTTFQKYYFPIPAPAALAASQGLFFFADGPNPGVTFWFNDIQYETLDSATLAAKFGSVSSVSVNWPSPTVAKGDTFKIDFNPNTVFYTVGPPIYRVGFNYFTLASDNTAVATVDKDGVITGQGAGTAHISAMLGSTSVAGQATVTGVLPLAVPTDIATAPTAPPGDVISMYGSTYTPVPIDSWSTSWSGCCNDYLEPYVILAHNVKRYTLHHFTGVEFGSNPINASAAGMTAFHMDYWTPNATEFFVRLVNNEGTSQTESTVDATSTINLGHWVSLDIPLSQFSSLTGTDKLGQMLLLVTVGHSAVFYFDNIYFHK